MLYAQLSPLHKLEIKHTAILKRDLTKLERRIPFPVTPWWNAPKITIAATSEEAIVTHDAMLKSNAYFMIYTDGSGIENIGAAAVIILTPMPGHRSTSSRQKTDLLGPYDRLHGILRRADWPGHGFKHHRR